MVNLNLIIFYKLWQYFLNILKGSLSEEQLAHFGHGKHSMEPSKPVIFLRGKRLVFLIQILGKTRNFRKFVENEKTLCLEFQVLSKKVLEFLFLITFFEEKKF